MICVSITAVRSHPLNTWSRYNAIVRRKSFIERCGWLPIDLVTLINKVLTTPLEPFRPNIPQRLT